MRVLCIDIGGTSIKYCVFNRETNIPSEIKSCDTPKGLATPDMTNIVFKIIDECYPIDFVSISNCAQMRDNTVVVARSKPKYLGANWKEIIWEKYNIPAIAYNDAHCATMGDYTFGLENKPDNFICMAIGTGINIGVIINGKLFTGDENLSCYLDHMTDLYGEGQYKQASTKSLLDDYYKISKRSVNGKQFISLLKSNDIESKVIYEQWIEKLAFLLRNITYFYNINNITICGGIMNADYDILGDIKEKYKQITVSDFTRNVNLSKSILSSSQLYGAYALALQHME